MIHGSPSPIKTFTAFEPVTFPRAGSAFGSILAAPILAKVSGSDVPKATNVIAVTGGLIPNTHPNYVANSETIHDIKPINARAIPKVAYPLQNLGGGTKANASFQKIVIKWKRHSTPSTSTISPSSFFVGWRQHALTNYESQVASSSSSIFFKRAFNASYLFFPSTSVTMLTKIEFFLLNFAPSGVTFDSYIANVSSLLISGSF